ERREFTLSHVPASLVPDLEVIQHANDEHVLRESAALAIVLQDLDASVRIEEHVESGGEICVLELTTIGIELRQLRDFFFELAPLVFREYVEPFVVGRDHETITAGLAQSLAEFRRDAEPSLRVDRVPEMSPKHCPPGEAKMPLLPRLNHTSWDFIPLRGTILVGVAWGCQAETSDFQGHSALFSAPPVGVGRQGSTAGGNGWEKRGGPRGPACRTSGPPASSPPAAECGWPRRGASTSIRTGAAPLTLPASASHSRSPRGDRSRPWPSRGRRCGWPRTPAGGSRAGARRTGRRLPAPARLAAPWPCCCSPPRRRAGSPSARPSAGSTALHRGGPPRGRSRDPA